VADYRGLVNAAKAGRSRPHHLQLIASIAVEGRKLRTCLGIPLWSFATGHVRYAAECGSQFRTLATPLRAVNRIRLLPSIREAQRMEAAVCWPAEYLCALVPLLCAVNAVALAHSFDRNAGWIAAKRGDYADTWRERHDHGCDIIARGLRSCRVPVF
jgi:hypothetical protein